ncbi:MAG: 4-hydroxy-tetrahydrodipicolinate synthase [Deltaproteobacteria bacterium]|nr:4-hydroxy-tetrahydrodipicolinate synthase [Deltaproteobacteria bacterium]
MTTRTTRFGGSMVALATPFTAGAIDWKAFAAMIERQIAGGSSALVPCGSSGEAATLTHEEHSEVVRFVVEQARARIPVIAGTGSNATAEAVRLTREAKKAGAAAALMISPYYNRPTQEGLKLHYLRVADEADLPIILYNIPGRTGRAIEAATVAELATHPNIIGLKESDQLDHTLDVLHAVPADFEIYAGDDSTTLTVIANGGAGVITTIGNLVPREMADLAAAALAGDFAKARALQRRLFPLMRAAFTEVNPIPLKHGLALLGLCRDELRLPLVPMTHAGRRAELAAALRGLGALA